MFNPPFWPLALPTVAFVLTWLGIGTSPRPTLEFSQRRGRSCHRCNEIHDGHHRCQKLLVGMCVAGGSIYGFNKMLRFETEIKYEAKLDEIRAAGESVQ